MDMVSKDGETGMAICGGLDVTSQPYPAPCCVPHEPRTPDLLTNLAQAILAPVWPMSWEKTNFVILSGKRKSGKDYVAHRLSSHLSASGISVKIIHLSEPIKRAYARLKDLDLDLLMSSAAYKEDYRTEMVLTRRARGWLPVPAVDEADTECALDDALYDLLVVNDSSDSLEMSMASAMSLVLKTIST
ncbi:unnamed protein product [Dibothriocephalus latus]|uniref:Phosphomevalonate kinase n=1 Tax=Dibothriocephalus latus TaxID=60516 RepID=A0A3P7NXP8_DIBLA|nr:unnamed protein product [Dibothriocephalus latus]